MDLLQRQASSTQRLQLQNSTPFSFTIKRELNYALLFLFLIISSITLFSLLSPLDQTLSLFTFPPSTLPPKQKASSQICDYSRGQWVWESSNDSSRSYYDEGCPFLDPGFRCRQNGRNDVEYLKWQWQPQSCDLPRFNASNFLESARNGRVVFAGDSIGRNQWESLVCMISRAVPDASSIYEENGNPISKHKGYLSIRFSSYNLTVEYYRAPFLMRIGRPPLNSPTEVKSTVRVDELNVFSKKWIGADVIVFNTGHWWNHDKTLLMGCYFEEGGTLNKTMDIREAFRRSVTTWKSWVMKNFDLRRSHVFFRSFSPIHYSNGKWNDGGECSKNTKPETNYAKLEGEHAYNLQISEAIEEMVVGNMTKSRFLNITFLSDIRKDGHPSSHREPGTPEGAPEDCSHWCLPGVPDTWNELLYANLLSDGFGKI